MNKPKLAFGLNLTKKPGASKPAPSKSKPMFSSHDDDSDDGGATGDTKIEEIGGDLDDFTSAAPAPADSTRGPRSKKGLLDEPPKLKSKAQTSAMFGDLSSTLSSRKNAEAATELDASVYEYDSIYDSMKPKKSKSKEDEERKPKYMQNLMRAADVRKRDQLIAEEKKIAREREAEGDEFADKEKFVTEAYKKQQEENKRLEEEERRREEEEAKKNEGTGMSTFYRKLLDREQERHAETVRAAEEMAKRGPVEADGENGEEAEDDKEKEYARAAQELNDKGASISVNEDGQVVDKRQLLKGGLNVGAKKQVKAQREANHPVERERREVTGQQLGRKQAMRERQSRMLAEQLEASLKRSREAEEAKREEAERAAKTRKTEGEISSAKERYLARKRAAEEEKKKAAAAAATE
ncbi:coiled-coil domain-containing 55 [Trichoderma arundinaceum]|uniref:Coiled-coil domain-containing 55 n=1 Tax=Trichoderma arundinaceum TaxID=490622 RepID=A0A395NXQ8_TRIAR|nr:coiled-coil domain-containing 55 [Trichoderma arundinaceum]